MSVQIDWPAIEARARRMTDLELHYAVLQCLRLFETLDRARGGRKDAGCYLDEANVYSAELRRRWS